MPIEPEKSLEIQGEIVRILGTFTKLTAELTARKKQYNYYRDQLLRSSVTSLRRPMFLNFPISVPSLAEQERIVSILDKFDALTSSITKGLPRENELRQKQYEYYRDLLLSFPKPE